MAENISRGAPAAGFASCTVISATDAGAEPSWFQWAASA